QGLVPHRPYEGQQLLRVISRPPWPHRFLIAPTRGSNARLVPSQRRRRGSSSPLRGAATVFTCWCRSTSPHVPHRPYEGQQLLLGRARTAGLQFLIAPTRGSNQLTTYSQCSLRCSSSPLRGAATSPR